MIPRSFIEQLVSQCDIEDLIRSYIDIKKAGRTLKGLCPFHSEKTPSFVVYPESQSFYCFGCGKGGDAIRFVMEAEHLDYPEAVRYLAKRMGLAVPEDGDDRAARHKARIYSLNREAARFFHRCLKSPAGVSGYEYLKGRGLSDATITTYGLGFAPDSWDSLREFLRSKGYTQEEMLDAAVVSRSSKGHVYDKFRNRVIFPIIDLKGSVVGFGGRVLDDSKPKYLNTDDTPVFKKSRNLFSLNFAKGKTNGRLILAEGYMDVISIYAAGFENVVATLGTALTEEQARLMSKYAEEVVIAYDSDGPGQAATHRAINLLGAAGLSVKVLRMEGAKDPDEYIKTFGAKRFEILLNHASDMIAYELAQVKSRVDMKTDMGKIEYVKRCAYILSEIDDPLSREVYAATVAREAGIPAETVMTQLSAVLSKKRRTREKKEWDAIQTNREVVRDRLNPERAQHLKEAAAEEGIIAYLLRHPDGYERVLREISPDQFVTSYHKRVFSAMKQLYDESGDVSLSLIGTLLSSEETSGVARILARSSEFAVTEEMLADYIRVLKSFHEVLSADSVKTADASEIEQYRQKLKSKK